MGSEPIKNCTCSRCCFVKDAVSTRGDDTDHGTLLNSYHHRFMEQEVPIRCDRHAYTDVQPVR